MSSEEPPLGTSARPAALRAGVIDVVHLLGGNIRRANKCTIPAVGRAANGPDDGWLPLLPTSEHM
jgi:hypothetical protein